MKDLYTNEDYINGSDNKFLNYINKHASRKNDVVMFGFIFMIIFYITVFVPTTPIGEQNSAEFSKTEKIPKNEQLVNISTENEAKAEQVTLILGSIK